MKCVILGANCKILARAIHALAKIGEEMYVEPRETSLSFRCVGTSHSAYCDFTFFDNFFSSYCFGNLDEQDALKCKISMRSALAVFKSPSMIDKLVETCHIRLEPNAETLIFIFKFKNSVVKTFFLPIIDCEDLSVPYSKDNVPNKLSAKSRVLTDAVQNFQQNLVEVTVEVTPQKLLMRNYVDETSTVANSTRTQLVLTVREFDKYNVGLDACITFCMKELRALLTFADIAGLPINIYFETTGKPVVFDLKNIAFEANLVLSTLNPDDDDMSVSTATDTRQQSRKRAAPKKTPRQAVKASTRRPTTNRSAVTNKTAISRITEVPTKAAKVDAAINQNEMEVDELPDSDKISDAVDVNSVDLLSRHSSRHSNTNDEVSKIHEAARRRANFIQSPSTSRVSSSRLSTGGCSSPVVSSRGTANGNEPGPSILSSDWRKRSIEDTPHNAMDEDAIPASPPPPSKKAKLIFQKCFQATFDPKMLPGHEDILAEDTDEEM